MAKKLKEKWLGVRVDNETYETIQEYVKATDSYIAGLVRDAVLEYMVNHPVNDVHKVRNEKLRVIRESLNLENS
jgi:hypothetical protein